MGRIEHAACGYSEYAPGCEDWECLVHRIDVAFARGWDSTQMQARLDASLAAAVLEALPALQAHPADDLRDRQSR